MRFLVCTILGLDCFEVEVRRTVLSVRSMERVNQRKGHFSRCWMDLSPEPIRFPHLRFPFETVVLNPSFPPFGFSFPIPFDPGWKGTDPSPTFRHPRTYVDVMDAMECAVGKLLQGAGEVPERDGLRDTPKVRTEAHMQEKVIAEWPRDDERKRGRCPKASAAAKTTVRSKEDVLNASMAKASFVLQSCGQMNSIRRVDRRRGIGPLTWKPCRVWSSASHVRLCLQGRDTRTQPRGTWLKDVLKRFLGEAQASARTRWRDTKDKRRGKRVGERHEGSVRGWWIDTMVWYDTEHWGERCLWKKNWCMQTGKS